MQESHREGVAIHPDPESCVTIREDGIEALTGAHAVRVLSCEIIATGVPTPTPAGRHGDRQPFSIIALF
jgi:hypothetical protein